MAPAPPCKPVLYVEDDENDALLLKLAFEQVGIENPLVIVRDGAEAIEYLANHQSRLPKPCLLITDLKMPKVDGFGVLQWFFSRQELCDVPVFAVSSSEDERQRALSSGASHFFAKSRLPCLVEAVAGMPCVTLRSARL